MTRRTKRFFLDAQLSPEAMNSGEFDKNGTGPRGGS